MTLILGRNNDDYSTNSNGSGKSSLFEAITWCLYKKCSKGNDVSHDYNGECVVSVHFSKDKDECYIIRYHKDTSYGNFVRLFINEDEVTAHTVVASQQLINNLIGMEYEHFSSNVIITEGMPVAIPLMTPTPRKEFFEIMTGFDITWNEIIKKLKELLGLTNKDLSRTELQMNTHKTEYVTLSGKYEYIKEITERRDEIIKSIELNTEKLVKQVSEIERFISTIEYDEGTLRTLKDDRKLIQDMVVKINSLASQYKEILDKKICPTCSQNYPEDKISEAIKKFGKLSLRHDEYHSKIINLSKQIEELESKRNLLREKNNEFQGLSNEINNLSSKKQGLLCNTDDIENIKQNMKEIENTLFDVKDSYNNIISRKTKLERFLTILSPSSEFRSLALEKYIQIYNDYLDEICALVYPEIKITFAIDKSMRGLDFTTFSHKSERTENYASLSRGRKKRVDIITQLAFYRLLEVFSSVKFDLVVFDEIFDGLDSMGIEMIIKAIEQLWSNMKVYIVSHNEQLKGYFEKTLTIEMADGASQIVEI